MKKKDFVTLLLAEAGSILLCLGLCLALLPTYGALRPGLAIAILGGAVLLAMLPVRLKTGAWGAMIFGAGAVGATLLSALGAMLLGLGLCMSMIWDMLATGILVAVVGAVILLCLIPVVRGLR